MKILITGHQGFIGANIAQYFLNKGHEVEGFEFVPGVVPDVTKFDWVIHLGAISDTTETDIDKVWEHNFEFTSRLLQVCDHFGVNLQLASSASVYGPNKNFKETDPCLPQSPYAWSKYLIDRNLTDVGFENFTNIVQSFRYFNVYGPGEGHKGDQMSLVSKFQKQAVHDGVIKLFEDSENYQRDLICVYDVARIHEEMMTASESGIFNVGTGYPRNLKNVAEVIATKYNAEIEIVPMPDKLKGQYQQYTCADTTKISEFIDVNRWITLEDYLND